MHKWIERTKYAAAVLGLLISVASGAILPSRAYAAGEAFTGSATVSGEFGGPIAISDLQVSGTGDDTISLRLYVDSGSLEMTTTTGITFDSDPTGGTLYFNGTRSNVNTALATLQYTSEGIGDVVLEVSLSEPGEIYYPGNGHLYEIVQDEMDWTSAEAAAQLRTKYGADGYLATMTSAEENAFVAARLTDAGWMGAADIEIEDDWQWIAGPEDGTSFWYGLGEDGGAAVDGNYENWGDGEPNNAGDEDCAQFLSGGSGEWNDLPCVESALPAYVVEYGATGDMPTVATKTVTITTTADEQLVGTCAELAALNYDDNSEDIIKLTADIDCDGVTVNSLFSDDSFEGEFDGQGHVISNLVIDDTEDGNDAGLFSDVSNAVIKNVTLDAGSVTGDYIAGSIAGYAFNTSFENVHSNLTVSGQGGVGGLIGEVENDEADAAIENVSATGNVSGGSQVGGLIGYVDIEDNTDSTIWKAYATGTVTSTGEETSGVGGLIGEAEIQTEDGDATLTISDVYAWGNVTAPDAVYVGGLIGDVGSDSDSSDQALVDIKQAYAKGAVDGAQSVGGLIGYTRGLYSVEDAIELSSSFAAGAVTSGDTATAGAIIGQHVMEDHPVDTATLYYDETSTLVGKCDGDDSLAGCTAVNAGNSQPGYFKDNTTNPPLNTWEFEGVWVDNVTEYPTFEAIPYTPDAPGSDDDSDGISQSEEEAAPNEGDANNDGVVDSEQAFVSSFVNDVTGNYVVLELDDECSNTAVDTASETSKPVKDSGFDYPAGLLGFTSVCGTNGFTATITQYYYGVGTGNLVVRKFNPTTNAYFTISGATIAPVTIGGASALKVTYQITDGGSLDIDGIANGTIVDPAGLALAAVGVPNTGLGGNNR